MHFIYIIYSSKADKYYTGESNNVPARLELHNSHKFLKAFTKAASDWEIKLIFRCETKKDAVYLERYIKRMKSRKFIEKIIDRPEILEEILSTW
ncbi:GIY-YIG nuclease family protein [Salinimicrobium sp. CDJ15-81-2]|nr:GIY-YIG nuclease family protein [Salinimicrobium nanhaiense]